MSEAPLPAVSAEATSSNGAPSVHLKIGTPQVELNVWMSYADVARLEAVSTATWLLASLRIGEVAGAPAWWSVDDAAGTLSILVGPDDETWDVGVTLPLGTLDVILTEVAQARVSDDGR